MGCFVWDFLFNYSGCFAFGRVIPFSHVWNGKWYLRSFITLSMSSRMLTKKWLLQVHHERGYTRPLATCLKVELFAKGCAGQTES